MSKVNKLQIAVDGCNRQSGLRDIALSSHLQSGGDAANNLSSTIETARHCGFDPSRLVLLLKHEMALTDPQAIAQ